MLGKEEFLNMLKSQGRVSATIDRIRIYLDQFNGWLIEKGIRDMRAVTSGMIREYQRYLVAYRKANGKV